MNNYYFISSSLSYIITELNARGKIKNIFLLKISYLQNY